jgi:hypothetical protein
MHISIVDHNGRESPTYLELIRAAQRGDPGYPNAPHRLPLCARNGASLPSSPAMVAYLHFDCR